MQHDFFTKKFLLFSHVYDMLLVRLEEINGYMDYLHLYVLLQPAKQLSNYNKARVN